MKDLSEAELGKALSTSTRPLAAAFTRKGAPPSDALVASLLAIEGKLGGRMDVVRLDVDACATLAAEQRIHKVPELLVWAAGGKKLLARTEGAMGVDEVLGLLEHALTRA